MMVIVSKQRRMERERGRHVSKGVSYKLYPTR